MMSIQDSYDKFIKASINGSPYLQKVVLFSTMPMEEKQEVQSEISKLFLYCDDPDAFLADHLLQTNPILLWDRSSLLEKYGVSEAISKIQLNTSVYNSPHGIIVSKIDTLKILKKIGFSYIPETYFTKEEAYKKLKFPVIAKASNTFQSRGVEKVKNKKTLKSLGDGFTIFQEQIEIDEEYRIVFFCGREGLTMLAVFRRDPENDKAKELRMNEAEGDGMKFKTLKNREKSDFSWTQIDPRNNDKLNIQECYNIANTIFAINPTLKVSGLDIAVDKNGKHWFIESNSTPGLFSNMLPLIYKFIYEDSIANLSPYGIKKIQELSFYFASLTMKDEPNFKIEDPNILYNLTGYI